MANTDAKRQSSPVRCQRDAFTLVELMVVIVIISILIGAVVVAGGTLVNSAKVRQTEATLTVLRDAIGQFASEQASSPTISKATRLRINGDTGPSYHKRYGYFPPDELDVFTSSLSLAPRSSAGAVQVVPGEPYEAMRRYTAGLNTDQLSREHRDLAAVILAIELYSDKALAMLERLPDSALVGGLTDPTTKNPLQYLDRDSNGQWDPDDLQIRQVVDSWGQPIAYMSQRDWTDTGTPVESSNHASWNQASTEMIRLNAGQPILFSWGPDGKEQLNREWMGDTDATAALAADWVDDHKINGVFNLDNVYADPSLAEKLAQGE